MSDGLKHKLTMPSWHIPYLEKHRIYDLFNELARELVVQQPVDHVLFLKQILTRAAKNRDVPRVIILSSPKVNAYEVARLISVFTKQAVIGENTILSCIPDSTPRLDTNPKLIIKYLTRTLRTEEVSKSGWIVVDCIRTSKEAKLMLEAGILPTHVLHLIPPYFPPLTKLLYCGVSENWPEYRKTIMGIRDVFKTTLVEVFLQHLIMDEVVQKCVDIITTRKSFGGPLLPRLLLLGPRGCGRKTQASLLAQNLNLIPIDFEYLLCQAWTSETDLGKQLRTYNEQIGLQSDLLSQVVNQRILEDDCLKHGWVLTGFPYTETDFRYLDSLDTPPNRVIFIDCNLNTCKTRLVNRKVNVVTGSVTNIITNEMIVEKLLASHPKDSEDLIDAELNFYCEHYGSLRSYCGETASVVNGDQPIRWVYECIAAVVVKPAPPCSPRVVYVQEPKENDLDASSSLISPINSYD